VIKTEKTTIELPRMTVLNKYYSQGLLNLSIKYVPTIRVEVDPQTCIGRIMLKSFNDVE
jgi:hypothetical protein